MKKYALNDTVHELLSSFAAQPTGSLLITGPLGSGLTTSVQYVVTSIYGERPRADELTYLTDYAIENVRDLVRRLGMTRTNTRKPRVVVIDDADKLSLEAQTTLLKVIEEPPAATHFVLATSRPEALLDTIRSRTSHIKLKRPSKSDLRTIFKDVDEAEFERTYLVSDGWPGTLRDMLESKDTEVIGQIELAKDFLQKDSISKIAMVSKYRDKLDLLNLLNGLEKVTHVMIRQAAIKKDKKPLLMWVRYAKVVQDSRRDIEDNIQLKLVATALVAKLR